MTQSIQQQKKPQEQPTQQLQDQRAQQAQQAQRDVGISFQEGMEISKIDACIDDILGIAERAANAATERGNKIDALLQQIREARAERSLGAA
jgi:hypothetical protein